MVIYVRVGSRVLKYEGMDESTVRALASAYGTPEMISEADYSAAIPPVRI